MAYTVTYDGEFLFDPYGDDVITDSTVSGEVNAAVYFDFTIESTHRLYDKIEEKAGIVKVYSDKKLLFMGEITDIQEDFYGSKQVSCVDPRDHLNDVLLRPYSTVSGEQPNTAPSSVDGYFQWLVDRYNAGTINQKFHFQVGVNQGAYLDKNNYIYRSSEQFPSVGSELEDKILDSLGGYLTLTYPEDIPTLNLYADVHQANTQIIDFGVTLIDFTKTTGTNEQYTAIRPEGGTPEKDSDDPDAPDPEPTTIESLGDGVTSVDSDYVKKGDVVYCQSAVNRYGYREYSWTDSDTTDPQDLLEKAIADLKKKIEPKLTIEVKAVDMALFMEGYDHLECGQVARVRSKPHDIDEYLLVSSMDIDLKDPSQTKYTLGQAFDSLTGEQSSFVKSLNSGINSSLDAAASIDKALKDQAEKVDQAVTDAGNALDTANDAQTSADIAKETADNAQSNLDDLKIGGRNLILNSDFSNETTGWTAEAGATLTVEQDATYGTCAKYVAEHTYNETPPQRFYTTNVTFEPSAEDGAMLSFMAKADEAATLYSGRQGSTEEQTHSITTEWGYFSRSFPGGLSGSLSFYGVGTFYITDIKYETGNKATDWTPAPEDVQQSIGNAQSTADAAQDTADAADKEVRIAKTSIELLNNSIRSLVTDANGSSLMTQTSSGWTFNIGGLQNSIEQNATNLNTVMGDLAQVDQLAQQTNDLANDLSAKTAYINMSVDDSGDPCIVLGRPDSPFKLRITNTSIDFMEGTSRIAYITNHQLYIESSVVTDEMKVGANDGFVWRKRGNGNMGLRWESGSFQS